MQIVSNRVYIFENTPTHINMVNTVVYRIPPVYTEICTDMKHGQNLCFVLT